MSLPVPLGVRIYSYGRVSMDRWITQWVTDLSYRSVIPGGFASATIKMVRPRMMQTPEVVTGTATASGAGTTSTLPCPDADAADINTGDRVWIFDSGGSIRFGGARFRVTGKSSAGGTTTITFNPPAPGAVSSGDVMRAATPGHFQYADPVVFDELTNLFNRVQIVDLRTMEIVWEGRIEDPERDSDDDSWTLGCLGAMVVASDITRPMFYADNDFSLWAKTGVGTFIPDINEGENSAKLTFDPSLADGIVAIGPNQDALGVSYYWQGGQRVDASVGRFDITYSGSGSNVIRVATCVAGAGDWSDEQYGVDMTAFNAATTRKTNIIGDASSFTGTGVNFVTIKYDLTANYTLDRTHYHTLTNPRIQVLRYNENATLLTSVSDYPNDYVTVPQVVRDVVGRYLNGGWYRASNNVPFAGQVRSGGIFVDTTSTAQIQHLTYYDGATAADIFGEMMAIQTDAYWAIWESNFGATDGAGGINDFGFRFEWTTWPDGWGYQLTSADGLNEKPDGEDVYNFIHYNYPILRLVPGFGNGPSIQYMLTRTNWDGNNNRYLADASVTRAFYLEKANITDGSGILAESGVKLQEHAHTKNSGTVTVKRPIHLYDTGSTSNSGASRMLDPWQIRPGKLVRITDMVVPAKAHDFSHGNTAPPIELDGTIFKVVTTEYNAADNACTLELDQVTTWRTETQIAGSTAKKSTLVVKG